MARPARIDREMMSGSGATYEFVLTDSAGRPAPLASANVEMHISKGQGRSAHLKKTSTPETHYNSAGGVVRFTVSPADVPARAFHQTWWYEIWRIPTEGEPKVHIVGELQLLPSSRIN